MVIHVQEVVMVVAIPLVKVPAQDAAIHVQMVVMVHAKAHVKIVQVASLDVQDAQVVQ